MSSTASARVDAFGLTHKGLVRKNNEDGFFISESLRVVAVADGMGGHAAGEVASRLALEAVEEASSKLEETSKEEALQSFDSLAASAHEKIYEYESEVPGAHGLGTTLLATFFDVEENRLFIHHIGDSRLYRMREGIITPLTHDHSLVFERYVDMGTMSREEARTHKHSNIISKVLGGGSPRAEEPDRVKTALEDGDLYLLCTDGLTDRFPEAHLARMLREYASSENRGTPEAKDSLKDALLTAALDGGGTDNITFVAVDYNVSSG